MCNKVYMFIQIGRLVENLSPFKNKDLKTDEPPPIRVPINPPPAPPYVEPDEEILLSVLSFSNSLFICYSSLISFPYTFWMNTLMSS